MPDNVSQYQKFETRTIHRSQLKKAPYNPRVISDKARAKLKKNLAKVGLLEPPIWNERTGNIVGGHQRITCLDSLHKSGDYSLTVAVVNLSEKDERSQNIALNNGEAQGEWDLDKLEAMFQDGIELEDTGFDAPDLLKLFGTMPGEESNADADQLEAAAAATQAAKEIRKNLSNKASDPYSDDQHYYMVLVGGNDAQRRAITDQLALDDNRYQDIRLLARLTACLQANGIPIAVIREWAAGMHDDQCEQPTVNPDAASEAEKNDPSNV